MARIFVANAPWDAPKTRDPTGNLGLEELVGVAMTVPANSAPAIQGKAERALIFCCGGEEAAGLRGWFWYFP